MEYGYWRKGLWFCCRFFGYCRFEDSLPFCELGAGVCGGEVSGFWCKLSWRLACCGCAFEYPG